MAAHPIIAVVAVEQIGDHTLRVEFDDGAIKTIDFGPILYGNIYGPLRDPRLFGQVAIDPDFETLVWPNGADFDPATLRYWEEDLPELMKLVESWKKSDEPART
jgi:hypothetical protein